MRNPILQKSAAFLAVAAVAATAWLLMHDSDTTELKDNKGKVKKQAQRQDAARTQAKTDAAQRRATDSRRKPNSAKYGIDDADWTGSLSSADKKIAVSLQNALDADDLQGVLDASLKAQGSEKAEVRMKAVEALGWFGEKALAELTPFMADPDEDVAHEAVNAWELGLSEVESAKSRMEIALMALNTISAKDALTMIGNQFANAATDIIAEEDIKAATEFRVKLIQDIVYMIADERSAPRSDVAKDIYEEVTGFEWRGMEEAERYLSNPDGYDLPEEREGSGGTKKDNIAVDI